MYNGFVALRLVLFEGWLGECQYDWLASGPWGYFYAPLCLVFIIQYTHLIHKLVYIISELQCAHLLERKNAVHTFSLDSEAEKFPLHIHDVDVSELSCTAHCPRCSPRRWSTTHWLLLVYTQQLLPFHCWYKINCSRTDPKNRKRIKHYMGVKLDLCRTLLTNKRVLHIFLKNIFHLFLSLCRSSERWIFFNLLI